MAHRLFRIDVVVDCDTTPTLNDVLVMATSRSILIQSLRFSEMGQYGSLVIDEYATQPQPTEET